MNTYDIKRYALVLAVQAEIEGMKANNLTSEGEYRPPIHPHSEFCVKAQELRDIAAMHDDQL